MYHNLHFRRQFLLSRAPIAELADWQFLPIAQYYIYVHPDLEVNSFIAANKTLVLIGSIFDSNNPAKGNQDILQCINADVNNHADLFSAIKKYAGRYALFYRDEKNTIILNDALGLREIYFCTKDNQIVCGSQPNLLVKFAKPEIKPSSAIDFLEFYNTHSKDGRWNPNYKWIGDETYYDGIKHLLPNHYLNIEKRNVRRYWPNAPIEHLVLEEAVSKCCSFLQDTLKAMAYRHPLMLAVTAGTDSRTLLAASRDIRDKVYYFINDHGLGISYPDIAVPKNIFEKLGLPFHVHTVPKEVDDEFRQIFLSNTFFASDRILSTICNIYFKNHSGKVNIIGIGEIGRTRFGKQPKCLNSYRLIYKMGYREGQYITKKAEQILAELLPVGDAYNINVLTLYYWEHTLGNWVATGNSESDIAIEELNPFSSHSLYETFLGVDDRYTDYSNPIIFREMIRKMWPELLGWPINPPIKLRDKIMIQLEKIGLRKTLKEIKYQSHYIKYRLKKSQAR
jgi:hypothetical protein